MAAQTMNIPAKITKTEADKQEAKDAKVSEGEEEIEIGGKKLKTKWVETKMTHGDMVITSKAWTCEDVPGQVVKMTSTTTGPTEVKSEGILLEFKAEKK